MNLMIEYSVSMEQTWKVIKHFPKDVLIVKLMKKKCKNF